MNWHHELGSFVATSFDANGSPIVKKFTSTAQARQFVEREHNTVLAFPIVSPPHKGSRRSKGGAHHPSMLNKKQKVEAKAVQEKFIKKF
jgi:hypothetical protein